MSTFEHKGVYHSALVQASDPGGLLVRFKGKPHPSKFKDKPPFIAFEVHGDEGSEYFYNIENGDIHSYLSHAPQNEWVMLYALGSRESATVKLENQDGNPLELTDEAGDEPPPTIWPDDAKPVEYEERRRPDMLARFGEVYAALCEHVGPAIGDATRASIVEAAQKIVVTEAIQK